MPEQLRRVGLTDRLDDLDPVVRRLQLRVQELEPLLVVEAGRFESGQTFFEVSRRSSQPQHQRRAILAVAGIDVVVVMVTVTGVNVEVVDVVDDVCRRVSLVVSGRHE